jgi:hypothetical protein
MAAWKSSGSLKTPVVLLSIPDRAHSWGAKQSRALLVGEPDRPFDAKPTLRTPIARRYAESAEQPAACCNHCK